MNDFKVSFFGHRRIDNLFELEKQLVILIKKLISEKAYVSFLIGRNGEFDEYVASIIKRVQNEMGKENNELCLVLPYRVSDIEYYEKYYDNIIIPENLYGVHYKSAISLRNRWIVEQSDIVISYIEHKSGGAYAAVKYAEKLKKYVCNIYKAYNPEN